MSISYVSICPKCASLKMNSVCKYCNTQRVKTDTTFEEAMQLTEKQEEELVNHYIETLIKDTYDPKAREEREANEKPAFADYVPDNRPKCPTCGSTNIKKISTTSRMISIGLFGLGSKKIGKQWYCNKCGSDF